MNSFTPKRDASCTNSAAEGDLIFKQIDQFTAKPECGPKAPSIKDFSIIKPISRGAFGQVFLGYQNKEPTKLFAVKVMRKDIMINKNMVSQVVTERNALALSRSPFCVNLFYSLQTSSYVYLVMEYMIGGDLKSLLAIYGFFEEAAAKFYCAEIALALQYLHEHGIVHRDIKPDNMLISASGHVKLTDFGLSKIEMRRDLELSDLINCSPNIQVRTPGQLLSLTSHFSFGSTDTRSTNNDNIQRCTSTFMLAMNRGQPSDSEMDTSGHSKHFSDGDVSGVSPFFSADDIQISKATLSSINSDSMASYYTCNSSLGIKTSSCESSQSMNNSSTNNNNVAQLRFTCNSCHTHILTDEKENFSVHDYCNRSKDSDNMLSQGKCTEDSGISSRKCDLSVMNCELSAIEKVDNMSHMKIDDSCYENSRCVSNVDSITHETGTMQSPVRNISRSFKRPESFMMAAKRKRFVSNRHDSMTMSDPDASSSTGLTQEIDILDLGSSTPKKRKARSPLKGVLKVRSLSDDEMPINENISNVLFSTPVSSQKAPRRDNGLINKLKSTRFALPSSINMSQKQMVSSQSEITRRIQITDEPAMSPITVDNGALKTPKAIQTPFRTPKSVRRGEIGSSERILGTPDYLAPELLMSKRHGPSVDWWALGVCLYEFMTGVPPFNDETTEKVFDNILNRNIEWPQDEEALSGEAMDAVEQLLTMDPKNRPTAKDVQEMQFFHDIDFHNIESMAPPFIPSPDDPTDTGYFSARNRLQHLKLSTFDLED